MKTKINKITTVFCILVQLVIGWFLWIAHWAFQSHWYGVFGDEDILPTITNFSFTVMRYVPIAALVFILIIYFYKKFKENIIDWLLLVFILEALILAFILFGLIYPALSITYRLGS